MIPTGRAQQASFNNNEGKEASKQCGAAQYISTEVTQGRAARGDFRFLLKCAGDLCLACGPVCTHCKHRVSPQILVATLPFWLSNVMQGHETAVRVKGSGITA